MFSDPLSITIGSDPGALSLPRTSSGDGKGTFSDFDNSVFANVSHRYTKNRAQRMFRVDRRVLGLSETNVDTHFPATYSAWLAVDVPQFFLGDDASLSLTEQKELVLGLFGVLTASSNAGLIKFLGGES